MPGEGIISIFTEDPGSSRHLRAILQLVEEDPATMFNRSRLPELRWTMYQDLRRGKRMPFDPHRFSDPSVPTGNVSHDMICEYSLPNQVTYSYFFKSPLSNTVTAAVKADLPAAIRDTFMEGGCDTHVYCGPYEHCELQDDATAQFFGKSYLTLGFSAYGLPLNWAESRRLILASPALNELKGRFEGIVGPAKMCVGWEI